MAKKVLFLDRDGTIIREPEDFQIDSFEKLEFLPYVISSLSKIAAELNYEFVLVTNQDGLGTASFPEETFFPVQDFMIETLKNEGIVFSDIYIDRSFEQDNNPGRKPGVAMLSKYLYVDYDRKNSFVIGDRLTDVQLAKNLGTKAIYLSDEKSYDAELTTKDWKEIYHFLKTLPRKAAIHRKTTETDILLEVNLDGTGKSNVFTGLPFFDHMLTQISKHGLIDLYIKAEGELYIDEHHTIEDTAITLGEAFYKALGNKKGIERYGFLLPMDDCLAQVALDFGGRSWIEWDVRFTREKIGDVPTEMFYHFFKSFSDHARCNLNIRCEGENEHHKIESVFKAFAKSLKMAVGKSGSDMIPSTKGSL